MNWYEFFKRCFIFKKCYIRAGSLVLRMQLTSRDFLAICSRILVQDLVAPISLPQPSSPRVWRPPLLGRMDDVSKEPKAKEERHELPKKKSWSSTDAEALQQAVDAVFNRAGESLLGLTFSLTIADPRLPDIPLIGCSAGFATLCGYTMEEILGRSLGLLGGGFRYFLCSSLPGGDDAIWRMFFNWVETTNYISVSIFGMSFKWVFSFEMF